jgi:hypothetical protein
MSSDIVIGQKWSGRDALTLFATCLGPVVLFCFTLVFWSEGINQNIASFSLYGVIDALFCASMWKAGFKKDAVFPGLYAAVVTITVFVIYQNGAWHWGMIETSCSALVLLALAAWWKLGTKPAVIAGTVAISLATVPILLDGISHPEPWTWWFWISGTLSGWILYFLAPVKTYETLEKWLFNLIAAVFGTIITFANIWPTLF